MNKKYIVRLTDQERDELAAVIKKFKGASQKVRRAQILSKADADGPNWTDRRICEAFGCRIRTVEKLRQRLVECGFRDTLDGARRELPPVEKLLSGEQEARIIATRLGSPPPGYGVFARVVFGESSGGGFLLDAVDEDRPLDDRGQQRRTVQRSPTL
jgi:hypothetical protein